MVVQYPKMMKHVVFICKLCLRNNLSLMKIPSEKAFTLIERQTFHLSKDESCTESYVNQQEAMLFLIFVFI